ncbi:hypothetical protein TI04_06160 [Achromatium sp. WMS2]|nr:hypothetical protein TI04_06160 [Achromatium sp. WMS2]
MEQLQIVLLFINGFLISRVMIKTRLPQKLVSLMMGRSHNSLSITLFYLTATASIVSILIPNAITMLTLLPVLDLLSRAFKNRDSRIPTILTLAVLYGANIGGIGSITGTPANMLFVGYLKAKQIPGVENITFFSWLLFGVPLVFLLSMVSWAILCLRFNAWHTNAETVCMPFSPKETEHPLQIQALGVAVFYILTATILSFLMVTLPTDQWTIFIITILVCISIIWYVFIYKGKHGPIINITDTYSDLPVSGFTLIALVIVLGGILYAMGAEEWLSNQAAALIPQKTIPFTLLLIIALITIFATELLSNTMVQLAMFVVMLPISQTICISPIKTLLIITLTCTCTFMTPIATPVNALAFGSVRGISIWHFMGVGAIMNVVSAFVITYYVFNFVNF